MAFQVSRVGSAVILRDLDGAAFGSRIEAVDAQLVTVMKPTSVPAASSYGEGTPFDVLWAQPDGRHVLPTELVRSRVEGQVLLWELTPVAEPWIEQRREYVRVPAFGRVQIRLVDPRAEQSPAWSGYVVDVSEAALQATLWVDPEGLAPATDTVVQVDFTAHGAQFSRRGLIYGARRSSQPGEMTIIITFDQSEAEAMALRREVFAAQLDLRENYRRE